MYPMPTNSSVLAMLAGLIVAALIIGHLDQRLTATTRYRAALMVYALPALPIMAFGLAVASATWPHDAGPANYCRDALCRMAVFRDANLAMLLHQGVTEIICFGLMAVIYWFRHHPIRFPRISIMFGKVPEPPKPIIDKYYIEARFPSDRIFRVPARISKFYLKGDLPPAFEENDDHLWKSIIDRYPAQPSTELQREEGEKRFWRNYAELFMLNDKLRGPTLRNKQYIVEYFRDYEKWIFREFYAATGVIHETIMVKACFAIGELVRARGLPRSDDRQRSRRDAAIEKAEEALRKFNQDVSKPHMDRWEEWFFVKIHSSFFDLTGARDPVGPDKPASRANAGYSDETAWKPST